MRTCSRAALALSGRSTTSVTPTLQVTVNFMAVRVSPSSSKRELRADGRSRREDVVTAVALRQTSGRRTVIFLWGCPRLGWLGLKFGPAFEGSQDPVAMELGAIEDLIGGIRVGMDNRIRNHLLPSPSSRKLSSDCRAGGRFAVDARQIRRAPRRHPSDKNSVNRACVFP